MARSEHDILADVKKLEIDVNARDFDISPMFTSDGATEITCEEGPA